MFCHCIGYCVVIVLKALAEPSLLRSAPSQLKWQGSWLSTYLNVPKKRLSQISCQNLFSDTLHRPFLCAHTSLEPYTENIPLANAIPRISNLSAEDFADDWADKPFILTNPVRQWPVYQQWSICNLLEKYGEISFRAEAVDWPLKVYVNYMLHNGDESPLYLFDHSFVEKMGLNVGKADGGYYWPPDCFGEDLFDILEEHRPDRRWLIVGGKNSGSTFHKDPNATR